MLAAGARDLISLLLERLFVPAALAGPGLDIFRLTTSIPLLVVGLPLWAIHWYFAQRSVSRPEEQRAALRRLYGYFVLLVAMLGLLFSARNLLAVLLGVEDFAPAGSRAATAIASLAAGTLVWAYHWRVFSADRAMVEQTGATATLRRWYLVLVQAISLGMASYAAVDVLHQLLQSALAPPIGETSGIGSPVATLAAGLVVWLPHHLWARSLVRAATPLRAYEARSTLRQVYAAVVITAAAVAALGGLATLLYALLLAAFGGTAWQSLLVDHTRAIAVVLVAIPLWIYHRRQLGDEARLSEIESRGETARRVVGYLTAAIGLGALFFGLGGLLSTCLRLWLAPDVLGPGWRDPLSLYLALSVVALPVYGAAVRSMERLIAGSPIEERTLARRIYLYAALLFGIVATIIAVVALLRLLLAGVLGAAEPGMLAELGRWLGYTVIGAGIAVYHGILLRRLAVVRGDTGAGSTIALIANEPLRRALVAAFEREVPGATLRLAGVDEPERVAEALVGADLLVVPLQVVIDGPLVVPLRAFGGRRLLLATAVTGYDLVGARHGDDTIAREAAQAARAATAATPQPEPSPLAKQQVVGSGQ